MDLLSWNIQAAIGTERYRDYLLRAHRQVLHTPAKAHALERIADEIARHDLVCLQEIDLGGRRAGHRSQIETIAARSGHAHVAVQTNRVVPGISRHGNAVLSRWPLTLVRDLKLPGPIGGRGCLIVDVAGPPDEALRPEMRPLLRVACLHLSLGARAQALQLAAIAEALHTGDCPPAWVAMGDFNCRASSASLGAFCAHSGGRLAGPSPATYPAWRPRRDFDHIIGGGLAALTDYRAKPVHLSDHLPVAARLRT